jgi:hypothetical protein
MVSRYIIKVLTSTLPGGYAPIVENYNANKPADWSPIREAGVCEGGFEIPLNAEEISQLKQYNSNKKLLNDNDYVRQLRWSNGKLCSLGNDPLREEEQLLLGKSLIAVLGADKVRITDLWPDECQEDLAEEMMLDAQIARIEDQTTLSQMRRW